MSYKQTPTVPGSDPTGVASKNTIATQQTLARQSSKAIPEDQSLVHKFQVPGDTSAADFVIPAGTREQRQEGDYFSGAEVLKSSGAGPTSNPTNTRSTACDYNDPSTEHRTFATPPSLKRSRIEEPVLDRTLSEPSIKKPRLFPRQRRHILDPFDFEGPSINNTQPPSPLFFSNSSSSRPSLPTRFSSSDAAFKMLSKAKSQETHVKTVSLARGTVSTPFMPSAMQIRAASDRSSTARSASPDSSMKGDSSIGMISSIGVVELLEQDERPTFIIDLGDSSNYGAGQLRPMFTNSSLRTYSGLLQLVTGASEENHLEGGDDKSFIQFKSWLLSAAVNGESLNVCLPSFKFAGLSWSCSTLRKRLRLLSGAFLQDGNSPGPRLIKSPKVDTTPQGNEKPKTESLPEQPDYFGNAEFLRPAIPDRLSSTDVVPSTEMKSSRPASQTPDSSGFPTMATKDSDPISFSDMTLEEEPCFDWTRLPVSDSMPQHIQFARSIDWSSTALGPIELWSPDLRQMCNLIMGSPHPAAMYWGDDLTAIYNEAYVALAGQKHPTLMGQRYHEAWKEIWEDVKPAFDSAKLTGEATMKDDDCLFLMRADYLEETYFSWSIIPLVGSDGTVVGLYNPAFEKTRRKIAERRMLTLREIGERTAAARDVKGFWQQVLSALEPNEFDTPLVLLYSVTDDSDSDTSSIHSASFGTATSTTTIGNMVCRLEGSLGIAHGHSSAPNMIDLKSGTEGFGTVFRESVKTDKPVLLHAGSHELPASLLENLDSRGFGDPIKSVVICPIHPTTGEAVLGFLVLGINPRRPYDEDYLLFIQLLSRQLATSLASVVLFEEEIRRGQKAAKLAALDRMELSEQLAARTQEAIESETKFTRMAEFAPVGMFIANSEGTITYCNDTWYDISRISKDAPVQKWMDAVNEEDKQMVENHWRELVVQKRPITAAFRFQASWTNPDGSPGERWVLFSAYPEKHPSGNLKSVFGSFTDISQQKWAEGFQKRKMEEAVELKRQQENFIDMTSHEMRNPLSAILQCSDEISAIMTKMRDQQTSKPDKDDKDMDESVTSALEAAQTIALCAQHQKRIVDDILTLSKLDSELLLVTPVDAQPLTVVQRALKMHEGELASNDIKLEFKVDQSYNDLGIDWVRFDPSRVLQVLINLTTNAIKFTTPESERSIVVSLAASMEKPSTLKSRAVDYFASRRAERPEQRADWGDGEEVYIQFGVQDTGRGLTAEEKKMLFLRFSQASPRTHVQYGGSGLGLFISRQLTELQGGEIGVASEAGKGSNFNFYVRARRSRGPDTKDESNGVASKVHAIVRSVGGPTAGLGSEDEAKKAVRKPVGTKYILLVEDNLVNQRVLQKQLKNLGCVVQVANHGVEALDKLKQSSWARSPIGGEGKPLSVVLMDQEMPVMDGLTATKRIREMEKAGELIGHVPVIAVTANARSEQIQTALDAGMDDVVSKPFRLPDLIPKIEELMTRHPEGGA
ncbi:Hybrid signal transduction histidine kinase K [Elsinoe australis]|uniref:Hybrid signal transduction histidine kinase K n=1 Tax=Elsinoe australis TaxID=40998 RepID=A0A2P7ZXZ9_9PEZI|nr:Hybrid signal transduction histidine kinase K [Elsinoe australis]